LKRPVVLLKGGISDQGATAARSHTGSLAGNSLLAEGLFKQLGIHRAYDFIEMMDLTKALVLWRGRAGGRRMGVVTFSGASGIVAADHMVRHGMTLATLSRQTMDALKGIFPEWMKPQNPVDVWPAIERAGFYAYRVALDSLLKDSRVDGIFLHLYVDSVILQHIMESIQPLKGAKKPVAIWVIGDTRCFRTLRDRVEPMGVPVYSEVERGAHALSLMLQPGSLRTP